MPCPRRLDGTRRHHMLPAREGDPCSRRQPPAACATGTGTRRRPFACRPAIRRSAPGGRRPAGQSRHARGHRATGRCGAISANSFRIAASSNGRALVWQPILQGIVLSVRPKKSGRLYASIWNRERNESPLRTFTRAQGEKLAAELAGEDDLTVDWAMRYGQPSIAERLNGAAGGGLRAHPALSALPAIQREHDRNGERRRFRRAEGDALAAGAADRAALF